MKPTSVSHDPLRIRPSLATVLATATMAGAFPAGAAPIAIPNPGFEQTQTARTDGVDQAVEWSNTVDVWRQWTRTENVGPVKIWNPGASGVTFQGTLAYGFGGTAPGGNLVTLVRSIYSDIPTSSVLSPPQWDGVNYFSAACLLLDGTIGNPLVAAAAFDPTKIYTLTATVGKPPVFVTNSGAQTSTDPRRAQAAIWHGYAVQLAVGGTNVTGARYAGSVTGGSMVAQDSNSRIIPVDGYRTVTTTYFPNPANTGLNGQFLQLRLAALDNPADFKMTGNVAFDEVKLEEFAAPAVAYWDLNDTTAGAGGSAPTGTWDGASNRWTSTADGTGATGLWTPGRTAAFSAGADATAPYTITLSGTQNIGGLTFEDGNVILTGGTALELAGIGMVDVASGLTATVETPITQATAGLQIAKTGTGTLVLSGANTYTGGTTVLDGTLRFGASNVLADSSVVSLIGRSAGSATFDLNGNSDTVGGLVLGGSNPASAAVVSTGVGTLTLGGDVSYVNAVDNGSNPLGATISGKLDLGAAARSFLVNNSAPAADLTVSADITGSVALTKAGKGTLVLTGNNVGATGGMGIEEGVVQFDSAAAINGTSRDITVVSPGVVAFGSSFGAGNIPAALLGRIAASSDGIIAADNYAATNFNFAAAGLTAAYLGAFGDLSYTGTFTPNGTTYRLGGGGGTLSINDSNALTGSGNSLSVAGKLTLMAANDYDGGTSLLGGTVFPAGPVVLTLGNNGALGAGPITFQAQPNASTVGVIRSFDSSARTLANAVVLNGGLNVEGAGNFNFTDTTPINLAATRLFVIANPVTSFAQAFTGTGGITMDYTGPGTLILQGNNLHTGNILVNGGTVVLTGNNSAATGGVTLSSRFGVNAGLVVGSNNAVGGTLTIAAVPATIAAQGTRTIANAISANADFTLVGTDALTLSGTMTLNANRIITNNNTTTATTLGIITGATRNLTVAGAGNTTVTGAVTTTTGQLIKNGSGTLTLKGINTYTGVTTVNTGGTLALVGGSQNSAITVNGGGFLGFTPGSPTTSAKAVTLSANAKVRITGTPTEPSYTLLTTTATITVGGTLELDPPIPGYELVVETNNVLKLKVNAGADYLAWKTKFPGADLTSPLADFDGDGVINNDERIFGLNPTLGSSANPISVPLDNGAGTFSFTRRDPALTNQIFSVWTSTTLLAWSKDESAILTPGALVDEIDTVATQLSPGLLGGPRLFVRVRAESAPPPPPLLAADFEANNGGFTVVTTGGTAWEHGDPESPSQGGGAVLTGNGGSAKCWGTNLTGAIAAGTDTSLRSPAINLSGIPGGTTLSFALALDSDVGNTIEVNVIDATTGNFIANLIPATQDDDPFTVWEPIVVPIPVLNQQVRIEWRFKGLTFGFPVLGAYIDDVVVIKNP